MKTLIRAAVLFYVTMFLFLSVFVMFFILNQVDLVRFFNLLSYVYFNEQLRISLAGLVCILIFLNYICYYQVLKANATEKNIIAFDNPGGRVSVSLNAIEELIKRIISRFSEVREVKSRVSVSRKGLHIKVRLILRAEGSIPEVTSRVQDAVKSKIQDTIGIDEPIDVAIYVGKILPDQGKEKQPLKKEEVQKEQEQNVPFQGYRA